MVVPVVIVGVSSYLFFAPLGLGNSYLALILVHAVLGGQFRQRQIAPDRLHRNLGFEIRAVALPRRLHSRPFLTSGLA